MGELRVSTEGYSYLPKAGAWVGVHPGRYDAPGGGFAPREVTREGIAYRGVAPWGADNQMPRRLNRMAEENPLVSAAMEFKSLLLAGDGITPVRREMAGGKWKITPCYEYEEVNRFLEENDMNAYLLEQALDATVLGNVFPEVVLSGDHRRIVELNHMEASFSRLEVANPTTGRISNHFYSARWDGSGDLPEDVVVTPMLPRRRMAETLRHWMGIALDPTGRQKPRPKAHRYIVPVGMPGLGRPYYARPWWLSLADSGWLEFVRQIPHYKQTVLRNSTVIRYHVKLHTDFWRRYYESLGLRTEAEKAKARNQWLSALDDFLSNPENTGRAFLSERVQMGDRLADLIEIESLRSEAGKGGELIAELEETANILAYGMGVHPSLIGASPGKNKSINGTEARELFIIKQAMLQPLRERLLRPLYLVKAINGWPADIHFRISNLELTTLDQHTGAVRSIGNERI